MKKHVNDDDRFEQAWSRIVEFFPDAVLIVRTKPRGLQWRSTDDTWALGATMRYMDNISADDALDREDMRRRSAE